MKNIFLPIIARRWRELVARANLRAARTPLLPLFPLLPKKLPVRLAPYLKTPQICISINYTLPLPHN